jgi:hypothetical protein
MAGHDVAKDVALGVAAAAVPFAGPVGVIGLAGLAGKP